MIDTFNGVMELVLLGLLVRTVASGLSTQVVLLTGFLYVSQTIRNNRGSNT